MLFFFKKKKVPSPCFITSGTQRFDSHPPACFSMKVLSSFYYKYIFYCARQSCLLSGQIVACNLNYLARKHSNYHSKCWLHHWRRGGLAVSALGLKEKLKRAPRNGGGNSTWGIFTLLLYISCNCLSLPPPI